jgi:hypothetical protein
VPIVAVLAIVWFVGYGHEASQLARDRLRQPGRWFYFGGVLGPLGLRILRAAPPGLCRSCLSPVQGWTPRCPHCGGDVRAAPEILDVEEPRRAGDAVKRPTTPAPAPPPAAQPAFTFDPPRPPATAQPTIRPARPPEALATVPDTRTAAAAVAGAAPAAGAQQPANRTKAVVDPMRPVRLASGVFVEGSLPLQPGTWYQLTTQGRDLRITGPISALPNREPVSEPLAEIRLTTRGDRLIVAGTSEPRAGLRLVFTQLQDWTGRGVAREVNARRRALDLGRAAPTP